MIDLGGHAALVTGGSQGIGGAVAQQLVRCGASVVIHGLEAREVEAQVETCRRLVPLGSDAVVAGIVGDLIAGQPDNIARLIAEAFERVPAIDLLVANAGTYIDLPFLEMPYERLDRTMKLNVYAYFLTVQETARRWVAAGRGGRVVLVGSINGRLSEDVHVAYDASKGAVEAMVRSMAVSLAPLGIRVNGMAPGLVETPLTAPALADPTFREWMRRHTPNRQVPGPEACAGAVAFLLSDDAWHVHGQMLLVDGGMSAWQQPDP
ncbi:MAG TPA: SDR family oxidoreductase [Pirellulaceae bacterium]|nr:SDR family oxidoreductase [Pirellulaceae bacterium]